MVVLTLLLGAASFSGSASAIPEGVLAQMRGVSLHPGCPVGAKDLRYLEVTHWSFELRVEQGVLVVHKDVADEILAAFKALFEQKFPIERMRLVSEYGGSDDRSMEANNTSAFNCRSVTGKPGVFSKHSYGTAIDINPRTNPYVRGTRYEPKNAGPFLDRSKDFPGSINAGGPVVSIFAKLGWTWGGSWRSLKDYQHFEKRKGRPR
ncbi:MAG: M15 family metallopeptidase [Myxococcota bacterium]